MKKFPFVLFVFVAVCSVLGIGAGRHEVSPHYTTDISWHPDILGDGYEARYVNQGEAFDGPCRCTIVRRRSSKPSKRAYFYVHGFNDYFFQADMGKRFCDSAINFYAVDLRRYGRSLEPWQYPFNIRRQREYFADIDSALAQIRRDGNVEITLSGHSTGGLTVMLYAALRGARCGVDRVVGDSPFLEWNYSAFMRNFAIPVVSGFGGMLPNAKIKQAHCDPYAQSLLKQYHGEWEYNTDWKMIYSPPVTLSWIRAINSAQSELMRKGGNITVPVLVMHSSAMISGCEWTPGFQKADCVLNPHDIAKRGKKLGKNPVVVTIKDGIHDLILSAKPVRDAAYDTIFRFIRTH